MTMMAAGAGRASPSVPVYIGRKHAGLVPWKFGAPFQCVSFAHVIFTVIQFSWSSKEQIWPYGQVYVLAFCVNLVLAASYKSSMVSAERLTGFLAV